MATHLHFIIWAAERIEQGTGNFMENTIIDLVAASTEEALARARGLVKKNVYVLRQIVEHLDGACVHK